MNQEEFAARKGTLWLCSECRKTSSNRAEDTENNGWDVNCFRHAILCTTLDLQRDENGLVYDATAAEYWK